MAARMDHRIPVQPGSIAGVRIAAWLYASSNTSGMPVMAPGRAAAPQGDAMGHDREQRRGDHHGWGECARCG
jgi:hypothetical protein